MPNLEILNEKKIKEELNQNENESEKENEENNDINQDNIENNEINENNENNAINENDNDNDNDNTNIIDLNDEEIKNISLQDEIQNFNDIYKKISQKFKLIQQNNNFKDEFQSLIKNEINKINTNYDNNLPNYIYSTNVIESQLSIYHNLDYSIIY